MDNDGWTTVKTRDHKWRKDAAQPATKTFVPKKQGQRQRALPSSGSTARTKPSSDAKTRQEIFHGRTRTGSGREFNELRSKILCQNMLLSGWCNYGNKCVYAHSLDQQVMDNVRKFCYDCVKGTIDHIGV